MTQLRELYRCELCGNVVEIAHEGAPALVCCEQPMTRLEGKTEDEGKEKHLPVVENTDKGINVKIGSIAHPMEDKHYIKFIEVLTKNRVMRVELNPGESPEAKFCTAGSDTVEVREFCTVHGLWRTAD